MPSLNLKRFKTIFILIFIMVLLNGCIPMWRSAHGLRPGEVKVNYIWPLQADVAVGISKDIDFRYFQIGNAVGADIRYHSHGSFDRAISLGYSQLPKHVLKIHDGIQYQSFGTTVTISKSFYDRIDPYLSCSVYFEKETQTDIVFKEEDMHNNLDEEIRIAHYYAAGFELSLFPRKNRFNIIFTPEIDFFPSNFNPEGFSPFVTSAVGLSYKF